MNERHHRLKFLTVLASGVLFVASLLFLSNLRFALDFNEVIDKDLTETNRYRKVRDHYEIGYDFLVTVKKKNTTSISQHELCAIRSIFKQAAFENNLLWDYISPFNNFQYSYHDGQLKRELTVNLNCQSQNAPLKFTSPTLKNYLQTEGWKDISALFSFNKSKIKKLKEAEYLQKLEQFKQSLESSLFQALPSIEILYSGDSAFHLHFSESMKNDSYLTLLIVVVAGLLYYLFFGSMRIAFYIAAALIYLIVTMFGFAAIFGWKLDPLLNSVPLVVTIAAIQDSIYAAYIMHFKKITLRHSLAALKTPSFLTSLTTIVGFGSLMFSDLEVIQRFGALAAVGAFIEWLSLFVFLPAVIDLKILKDIPPKKTPPFLLFFNRFSQVSFQVPRIILILSFLLFLSGIGSLIIIEENDDPKIAFEDDHPWRKSLSYLKATRNWEMPIYLEVPTKNPQISFEIEKKLSQIVGIQKIINPWKDLENKIPENLQKDLDFYLRQYSSISEFKKNLAPDKDATLFTVFLKSSVLGDYQKIKETVKTHCQECQFVGTLNNYREFSSKIVKTLFTSFSLSLSLVIFTLTLILKAHSVPRLPWRIYSALWGCGVSLLFLLLPFVYINYVTCVFAAVLVGINGDNVIQFTYANKSNLDAGARAMGPASLIQIVFIATLSSVLFFSKFYYPKILIILLDLGFLATFVGDYFFLQKKLST